MLQHKCQAFQLFEHSHKKRKDHVSCDYDLNNKLFSYELKILNCDRLWENKKLSDENQRFDRIKSIHWYRLINIGWLADINMFNSMILLDWAWSLGTKTPWEDLVNKGANFADFVRFCPHAQARTQQSLLHLSAAIKANINISYWQQYCKPLAECHHYFYF